jgi:uncharacterized coiled-coil protein SlyX
VKLKHIEQQDERLATATAALAEAEKTLDSQADVIRGLCDQLTAAESHAARHHAELAGAEAVIGTLRGELKG